ncbi:hypothetical protein AKO1_009177 [Acrasis kona]|uniref:Uncharacterized protein n=1 Tax=Acrasis kona TaxID=1008807 RepID=A0AAW2ZKE9_9EUKA
MDGPPSTEQPTYVRRFVKISEAKQQGITMAIDYHDQFAKKSHAKFASQPSTKDVVPQFKSASTLMKEKPGKDVAPQRQTKTKTSSKSAPKAKVTKKTRSKTNVQASDKLSWVTLKGRATLIYNGKKITGKKASEIYKQHKALVGRKKDLSESEDVEEDNESLDDFIVEHSDECESDDEQPSKPYKYEEDESLFNTPLLSPSKVTTRSLSAAEKKNVKENNSQTFKLDPVTKKRKLNLFSKKNDESSKKQKLPQTVIIDDDACIDPSFIPSSEWELDGVAYI